MNQPLHRKGLADLLRSHPHWGGIVVSEKHRFIYMKPCRTGGTSILRQTLEQSPLDTFHFKDHRNRFIRWIHAITDAQLAEYRIFSIVRNPWDRAVSIASYFKVPLASFIRNHDRLTGCSTLMRQHSMPCTQYTHHDSVQFADWIGRFENLESDFSKICRELGFAPPSPFPHANRSHRTRYQDYYDAKLRQELTTIYRDDIERFDYRF